MGRDSQRRVSSEDELLQGAYRDGLALGRRRANLSTDQVVARLHTWLWQLNQLIDRKKGQLVELSSPTVYVGLVLGLVFGVTGFLLMMWVDYTVLKEFWGSFQTDDLGQSRLSGGEIVIKSLQVLAAATLFHFFYQSLSPLWRKRYIQGVFTMAVLLLFAMGVLYSVASVPEGTTVGGVEIKPSQQVVDTTLCDLGLRQDCSAEAAAAAGAAGPDAETGFVGAAVGFLRGLEFFSYLALIVIFVAVTSAAVMLLHVALRASRALFGSVQEEASEQEGADVSTPSAMRARVRLFLAKFSEDEDEEGTITVDDASGGARGKFLAAALGHFYSGYIDGAAGGALSRVRGNTDQAEAAIRQASEFIPDLVAGTLDFRSGVSAEIREVDFGDRRTA